MSAAEESAAESNAALQTDILQINDLKMYFLVTEGILISAPWSRK